MVENRETTRPIAWLALGLFMAGLLLPFVIYAILVSRLLGLAHYQAANVAAGVGAGCELLALMLGLIGLRHLPAKVAAGGAVVVIGLVAFAALAWVGR
jgi:hypothetical protein